ncbi:MAG: alpha-2-macroglobulin family protein, partial [Synechococcaceae cyanobacterium SM2_3_60]|nr:alpha-2-macroglobulin family protein [Synechococcaceae cyanobacterium SM2_3_60]
QQIGLTDLIVDPSEQRLAVTVTPSEASLAPGAEQPLSISLRDSQDQPVAGQVTLMVVNDAILQLNGYRPPDPLEAVFANRPLPTRWSSNLGDVVLAPFAAESLEKGWGYGGGIGAAAANTRTRRDFQPLAYYDARVAVDASGEATVTFPLPDDLTTWRVMAIAITEAQQFGQTEATFQTSLPLLANPLLPRFARVGDLFAVGTSITNTAQLSGELSLTASLEPSLVQFTDAQGNLSSEISERRPVPSRTEAVRQFAIASQVGQSTFTLSLDQGDHQDAFSLPLDVLPLVNPEHGH